MLVLRATTTWAGAFLEASSRGNAHNTLTNSAATNTVSFPGEPAWFRSLLHCPPPPLPFTLVGEWGGGGRFSPSRYFVSWHLDFQGTEALQDRILIFYEREITIYACMGNGWRVTGTCDWRIQTEPSSFRKLFSFPTAHLWLGEGMSIDTAPAGWFLSL